MINAASVKWLATGIRGLVMKSPVRFLLAVGILALLVPAAVEAADIRILCTNSIRGLLAGLGEAFARDTGHRVELEFGVTPDLVKRLAAGEAADAVLFVRGSFENAVKAGKVIAESRTEFGRIGVGVMVRAGTAAPDISTPDALKRALLGADSLAFNQRVSGTHFAGVLERLGIAADVKGKTVRPEVDAGLFEYMRKSKGNDFGISTVTAIMADGGKTVRLVGPLPAQFQSYEPYLTGLTTNARSPDVAKAFIAFLASPQTKATLAKRGVEQGG